MLAKSHGKFGFVYVLGKINNLPLSIVKLVAFKCSSVHGFLVYQNNFVFGIEAEQEASFQ